MLSKLKGLQAARDAVQALDEGAQPARRLCGGGHLAGSGALAARQAQVVAAQLLVEALDVAQHRERHVHSALEHLQWRAHACVSAYPLNPNVWRHVHAGLSIKP